MDTESYVVVINTTNGFETKSRKTPTAKEDGHTRLVRSPSLIPASTVGGAYPEIVTAWSGRDLLRSSSHSPSEMRFRSPPRDEGRDMTRSRSWSITHHSQSRSAHRRQDYTRNNLRKAHIYLPLDPQRSSILLFLRSPYLCLVNLPSHSGIGLSFAPSRVPRQYRQDPLPLPVFIIWYRTRSLHGQHTGRIV